MKGNPVSLGGAALVICLVAGTIALIAITRTGDTSADLNIAVLVFVSVATVAVFTGMFRRRLSGSDSVSTFLGACGGITLAYPIVGLARGEGEPFLLPWILIAVIAAASFTAGCVLVGVLRRDPRVRPQRPGST